MYIFAFKIANSIYKMLDKTKGVVLGSVLYNDHTRFVHIYTEKFGKMSYKISTSVKRSKKSQQQKLMFSPMSLLELDVKHSEASEIHQIKDATLLSSPLALGSGDPTKYAQCLYIAELLDRSIREIERNPKLWDFIVNSIDILYLMDGDTDNFHLLFTAKLLIPLGFSIDTTEYTKGMQFDMIEGLFSSGSINHGYYLNSVSAEYLYKLLSSDFDRLGEIELSHNERHIMLDILLAYLKLHIPEIGDLKSLEVLKALYF